MIGKTFAVGCLMIVASWTPGQPACAGQRRALTQRVERIAVEGKSFGEAIRIVAQAGAGAFVIGFEEAPNTETSPERLVRLSLDDSTLQDVMAALCAQDRRYTYSEELPGVLEVRPVREAPVLAEALSLPVPRLVIQTRDWPANLFARAPEYIPELGAYLAAKAAQQAKATGRPLAGSPGVTMTTNIPPPLIDFAAEGTTVRGALDKLAAYTLELARQQGTPNVRLAPSGWHAWFVPDASAPTGLGGYLRWSSFP